MRLTERELRRLIRQEADRLIRESSSGSIHRANIDEGFLDTVKGLFKSKKSDKSSETSSTPSSSSTEAPAAPSLKSSGASEGSGAEDSPKGPSLQTSEDDFISVIKQAIALPFDEDPAKSKELDRQISASMTQTGSVTGNLGKLIEKKYGDLIKDLEDAIYKMSNSSAKTVGTYIALTTAVLGKDALPEINKLFSSEESRVKLGTPFGNYVNKVKEIANSKGEGEFVKIFNRMKIWNAWNLSRRANMPIVAVSGDLSLAHFVFAPGSDITTPIGLRDPRQVPKFYAALTNAFGGNEDQKIKNSLVKIFNSGKGSNATRDGFRSFLNTEISSGAGDSVIQYIDELLTSKDFPSEDAIVKGINDAIPDYDENKKDDEDLSIMNESFDLERWNKLAGILKG